MKINYDLYKKMSVVQRDWWDFHFKNIQYPSLNINTIIIFLLISFNLIMFLYIILTNEKIFSFSAVQLNLIIIKTLPFFMFVIFLEDLVDWGVYFFKKYKEYNWFKSEGLL
jgi:hypothetical protein